ncbi:hypothetical protein KJ898_01080 [bacterium]|nr:hypothetical protein [bacterium]MBU1428497.1 hypothetical protein [bacterium]
MARPRKHEAIRITSFYIPNSFEPVIEKLKELAFKERKPLNNQILEAIKEHVEIHYPGNPQMPLDTWTSHIPTALTLQGKIAARDLKNGLDTWTRNLDKTAQLFWKKIITKHTLTLARVNDRLPGQPYDSLIKQAQEILDN